MSQEQLREVVLAHSVSQEWEVAVQEWKLNSVEQSYGDHSCICGHNPINKLCSIRNTQNGQLLDEVGSCCIVQFMGIRSDLILTGLDRATKGEALNKAALEFAKDKHWLTSWEFEFYLSIMRKRKLSAKQLNTRNRINAKILERQKEDQVRATLRDYRERLGERGLQFALREFGQSGNVCGMDPKLYGRVLRACKDPLLEPGYARLHG